jgi:hypothetical protein
MFRAGIKNTDDVICYACGGLLDQLGSLIQGTPRDHKDAFCAPQLNLLLQGCGCGRAKDHAVQG